jgi:hypothetical protein
MRKRKLIMRRGYPAGRGPGKANCDGNSKRPNARITFIHQVSPAIRNERP